MAMVRKLCGALALTVSWAVCLLPTSAANAAAAPGWEVYGAFAPTYLPPGGLGVLRLYIYDIGGEAGDGEGITLVARLPKGLQAASVYPYGESASEEPESCSGTTVVTCRLPEPGLSPEPEFISIPVRVETGVADMSSATSAVSVSRGGAPGEADTTVPAIFGTGVAPAGFENADVWVSNADGTIDTQAGSHPYELTMMFTTTTADGPGFELPPSGEAQALNVNLPPGLVGNPEAVPRCPRALFDSETEPGCPQDTQIGDDFTTIGGIGPAHAGIVYNLVPPPGVPAEFGLSFKGTDVLLDAAVRSGGNYGITVHGNVPQLRVDFNTIQIWGEPGEHGTGAPLRPFLTLPTSCGAPPQFSAEMLGTWQEPEALIQPIRIPWHDSEGTPVGMTGCEKLLHFQPTVSIAPDTSFSDSPAGLSARVKIPQGLNPDGLATSGLKSTTVTLPEGLAINPGEATGLEACQPYQDGLPGIGEDGEKESFDGPPQCPAASRVGTDEIVTPLLHKPLTGDIYVLQSNPPEVKLLLAASGEGVNLKLLGTVKLDEATGRITTTFDGTEQAPGTPDAPVSEITVSFNGGAQAALVTPSTCGIYNSAVHFTPWASPLVEDAFASSAFQITAGPSGSGSCTAPLPFAPTLAAGSTTDQAGGFTGFSMLLQRADGQQRIKRLQFKAPAGLSGMIAKVPLCPEPQASQGSCPQTSQIGYTIAGAGAGPYPFFLPQAGQPRAPIYLTGPHDGAPFGLSIVVPIVAGPFNLGTQVIRASIAVDPKTAQITVTTDPSGPASIPTILHGVPADLRSIDAVVDRPEFMFNPTNCDPMSFTGIATSSDGATAPLESRFQVGSCQALKFKPSVKVTTSAKTSRKNGARLTFKVSYPTGKLGASQATSQTNIKRFRIELPKRLPSRLTTLQKACLATVFDANPANCPAASVVGHAIAHTPVLPVPVSGPAYFVSHGNEAFPSLIMVLQGDGVTVDLESTTFISKKGVTSGTLKAVPDVPVKSFELTLPQGPHSALTAIGSLCKGKATLPTEIVGQNNAYIKRQIPLTVTGCKHKRARKHAGAARLPSAHRTSR
jgi:hypothetical protein